MARGDFLNVEVCDLLQGSDNGAGVGPHQAIVVQGIVRQQLLNTLDVADVLRAVVHAKGVARVQQASAMVEREHCVGPVQIWRNHKLQLMAAAQIDLVPVGHHLTLEATEHQILEELEADFGAQDCQGLVPKSGSTLDHLGDETRVVRLSVRDYKVVQRLKIDLLLEGVEIQVRKLSVRGVDKGGLVGTLDDIRIVGGSALERELDVKAVAIPIQRADGARALGDRVNSHRLQAVLLAWRQAGPRLDRG
mmetsp:Transcript_108754/g.272552  ORF Transcript_108754/g.272552 Transcript_108754/m.272552 type:complete len:249 (+) Transcript_108754:1764-2510(+)